MDSDLFFLPADKRTYDFGSTILVVATIRMSRSSSTLGAFSSGVPLTATSVLIGIDSGWGVSFDRLRIKLILSLLFSPRPIIPPQQTVSPDERTFFKVSCLLFCDLVVIIFLCVNLWILQ